MGFVSDVLFGKKEQQSGIQDIEDVESKRARMTATDAARTASERLVDELQRNVDPSKFYIAQANKQARTERGTAADRLRQLRGNIARQGLGRSSIGIGAEKAVSSDLSQRLRDIYTQIPEQQEMFRLQRLQALQPLAQSGGRVFERQIVQQAAPQRSGEGLLGLGGGLASIAGGAGALGWKPFG